MFWWVLYKWICIPQTETCKGNVIGVMLEPLTQAQSLLQNPIPIYGSNFFGGGFAGISAAVFHVVNDAPGTASPIPGLLAPFAFNPVQNVLFALLFAAIGGSVAGFVGGTIFKHIRMKTELMRKHLKQPKKWQARA